VFFRAQTFTDAGTILSHLFWPTAGIGLREGQMWKVGVVLTMLIIGHAIPHLIDLRRRERVAPEFALGAAMTAMLLLALVLSPAGSQAFIYFQF
jgi:hypothetical protein